MVINDRALKKLRDYGWGAEADEIGRLRKERDQLREALQDMMLGMDPERHDKARVALKATEDE